MDQASELILDNEDMAAPLGDGQDLLAFEWNELVYASRW